MGERDKDKLVGALVVLVPLILADWYFNDLNFLKAVLYNLNTGVQLLWLLLKEIL